MKTTKNCFLNLREAFKNVKTNERAQLIATVIFFNTRIDLQQIFGLKLSRGRFAIHQWYQSALERFEHRL